MIAKRKSTYNLSAYARDRLFKIAEINDLTVSDLIERFVLEASDTKPFRMVNILSWNPLTISGEKWEAPFTGYVRLHLPEEGAVRMVELSVEDSTFSQFTQYVSMLVLDGGIIRLIKE